MEDDLKLIFPKVVLHKFGIEFNQKFTGDVFNKLRPSEYVLADVFIIRSVWIAQIFENKPHFIHFSKFGNVGLAFGEIAPRLYTAE
jgi:hypothetical protein